MTAVLVTGAAGFVGANLARRLAGDGYDVHPVVRSRDTAWRLDPGLLARAQEADLRDRDAVARLVRVVRPHWIFHCAAYGAYSWERDVERMQATNVDGTANLLAACRAAGFEVFVNTGSSSEYGYRDHAPAETETPQPNSPYASTKLRATEHCAAGARTDDGAIATLRLYSAYGPWEEPNRLIPRLVTAAMAGTLPPLTRPGTARDFIYIDDVCDAYLAIAQHPPAQAGAVFNVGTGVQTTLGELVEAARAIFDVRDEPAWGSMDARSWDTDVWYADSRRLREQTGWLPRYSIAEGLRATRRWFEQHPDVMPRYTAQR